MSRRRPSSVWIEFSGRAIWTAPSPPLSATVYTRSCTSPAAALRRTVDRRPAAIVTVDRIDRDRELRGGADVGTRDAIGPQGLDVGQRAALLGRQLRRRPASVGSGSSDVPTICAT